MTMDENNQTPTQAEPSYAAAAGEVIKYIRSREERERKDAMWKSIKRAVFSVFVLGLFSFWIFFQATVWGLNRNPATQSVAIIPIQGQIAQGLKASADNVVPLIQKACESDSVKIIALEVSSPGGAPNESERIVQAIETCRAEKKKPIVAVSDGLNASAAYMISIHTDKVIAGKYTLVGSIGAVMRYIDASEAATRLGLQEHVFRSGPLKGGPTNLSGGADGLNEVNQEMVTKLGETFLEEVFSARQGKIKADRKDVFSGRIWTAEQALDMGLIDEIGTIESLSAGEWKDLKIHRYTPKPDFVRALGFKSIFKQWVSEELLDLSTPQVE